MADRPSCRLCESRKPKRFCPAVSGEICPQCCGKEREETLHCPIHCEYLLEARKHEQPEPFDPYLYPHKDVPVGEEFVEEHRELFTVVSLSLIRAANDTPGAVDNDVRECLEAAIKTYLTLDSGIIYESKPSNLVAAAIQQRLSDSIVEFRKFAYEKTGVHSIQDSELLRMLVFLQRLELTTNNNRRYGRAFLSALRQAFEVRDGDTPVAEEAAPASALII